MSFRISVETNVETKKEHRKDTEYESIESSATFPTTKRPDENESLIASLINLDEATALRSGCHNGGTLAFPNRCTQAPSRPGADCKDGLLEFMRERKFGNFGSAGWVHTP